MDRQLVADLNELRRRGTLKFAYRDEGVRREGFLAWFHEQVVAYENVCRHVPISLDYDNGQFFMPDQQHFVCQTHGAMYEPLTGKCVAGPCTGASLKRLPIELDGSSIYLVLVG